jgi:hypothetical protein
MRRTLQLATLTLLLAAATSMRAQITNPDTLVAPPPRNPAHAPIVKPTDALQWLWAFAQPEPIGRASDLRYDARFHTLISDNFNRQQAMWGPDPGKNPSLDAVIPLFLSRYGTVTTQRNRYLSIDGCVPDFCAAHGLLWFDLGTPHPLAIFAGVTWSPESHTTEEAAANYDLWLYPNRDLSPDDLPIAFTESIAHWDARLAAAHRLVPHIEHATLIEPNGAPQELKPSLVGANTIAPQPDTTAQDDQPVRTTDLKTHNSNPK